MRMRKEARSKEVCGCTRGCAGCSSWFRGLGRQPHTSECRARFAEIMEEDPRYQSAEKRKPHFDDKMGERKARHQARHRGAVSGSGEHQVPRESQPEPMQPEIYLDDQHKGRIREREEEEEEDTTAMWDSDPSGQMTAELGNKTLPP